MSPGVDLQRFLSAQESVWDDALAELRAGRKETHWMWFVFPQIRGLGTSQRAIFYGISGRSEAAAYAEHPILGTRLVEGVCAVLQGPERDMQKLFGLTDAAKFRSSLTLFERFGPTAGPCHLALRGFYGGLRDQATLEILKIRP